MKLKKGKWLAVLLAAVLAATMVPASAFADTMEAQNAENEEQTADEKVETAEESADETEETTAESIEETAEISEESTEETEETSTESSDEEETVTGSAEENIETVDEQPAKNETPETFSLNNSIIPTQVQALNSSGSQTESSVAKVGDMYYDTLAEAFNAVGTEGTVELVADAEISTRILIANGKNITLDLGSYTVRSDGSFFNGSSMIFENRGTFTVTGNGTIEAVNNNNPYIGIENSGGTLNVNSGNITGSGYGIRNTKSGSLNISGGVVSNTSTALDGQDCAVYAAVGTTIISGNAMLNGYSAAVRSYGGDVTVSGNSYLSGQFGVMLFNSPAENSKSAAHSTFKMTGGSVIASAGGLALSGNNTQSALCSAEITGGTIKAADEAAIYWPMEGELTIGGSAVVEGATGIEAKMGTINITGGTITGTGAYRADEPMSGGSQSDGSALLAASQMYGANSGQYINSPGLTVNITGGNLSGTNGNAVTVYNTEDTNAQTTNVDISGGVLSSADGRADVHVVNASGVNTAKIVNDNGTNCFVSSQSQTSVSVSSEVAAAAVDAAGNTSYYADVNEALKANTQSAAPVEIYVLANSEIGSEALESENVKLITANGVELEVESNVDGMKVIETVNPDGSKTYVLAETQNIVYVNGASGNDSNSGADSDNAVKTLEKAIEIVAEEGTIYICGQVDISSDMTISGINIKRADGYSGKLISIQGAENAPVTVILEDVVIDGNKESVSESNHLVDVSYDANLIIKDGTVLKNNGYTALRVSYGSGTNRMPGHAVIEGGSITGNKAPDYVNGGGIHNQGNIEITGGEISENAAAYGGGIHNDGGTVVFSGGEIKNNEAYIQGGGVSVLRGNFTMDGTASITENSSTYHGGGVYIGNGSSSGDSVFEMRNGTISGNTIKEDGYVGAGIFGLCQSYGSRDVIIRISGGIIAGEADDSRLISLYSEREAYPKLELSGSPDINGGIFLWDGAYADGFRIYVTGEFSPEKAIKIERQNTVYTGTAVNYAEGVTPDLNDFEPYYLTDALKIDGQNLVWTEAKAVRFYDEDGTEFKENSHGVIPGETIGESNVPETEKTGYTFLGWYEKDASEPWDFAEDTVEKNTNLYARWSLNAPEISIAADITNPHEGTEAVLTAIPSHELDSVDYAYQWYKDGEPIEGATGNTIKASEAGNYTVKVTASDGEKTSGEVASSAVKITVEGHAASDEWKSDGSYHWKECTQCGIQMDKAGHTFEWVTDKEATDTQAGSKHEECTVCGYAKEAVEIPATGDEGGKPAAPTPEPTDKPQKPADTNSGKSELNGSPETGDINNSEVWVSLIAVAIAAFAGTYIYGRRKK